MKLLLLTPQLPYPPQQGTSLRNYHILRGLAGRHALSLLSFVEPDQPLTADSPLHALCRRIVTVPVPQRSGRQRLWRLLVDSRPDMAHRLQSDAFDAALRGLLAEEAFDVVQIEGIELARALPLIRQASPASRILFDDHNAEAELQYRNFLTDLRQPRRWPAAAYSLVQTGRLRRFERRTCQAADWVSVVSPADRAHLCRLLPALEPLVVPNSIDVTQYQVAVTDDTPRFDVVFIGKMDYRPNIDAALWFGREIWPRVLRARPGSTWAVVGQKPHARLAWLGELPGVTVTGRVAEVQPYLAGAAVFVMPFRAGSGTRLKFIEAMAAGKAIVSTTVGAEGFPVGHGREVLLVDEPAAFAAAVVGLLSRPGERARLGHAARQFAAGYDWRAVVPLFETLWG